MKNCLLMIDGGTTNTCFTLFHGDQMIARIKRKVGASDTVHANRNQNLESAVKQAILDLNHEYDCRITDAYASGMITSNAGLREIPHINAPVTLEELASAVKTCRLQEVSDDVLFHFVPGIKFVDAKSSEVLDIMRGEEVEIFGALEQDDMEKSILFLHFGSHNKMIRVKNGAVTQAVTTLSGELFWAVCNDTILKSSVPSLDDTWTVDQEFARKGYRSAAESGVSRALFLARIKQVLEGCTKNQAISFILGVLIYADVHAFSAMLSQSASRLVLYGRDSFISAFFACRGQMNLPVELENKIQIIPFEQSQLLSVKGLRIIHQHIAERSLIK